MSDIYFYDFDFNLLYILPNFGVDRGYISINTKEEFNGSGSVEIVFIDNELKALIRQYRDDLMVVWKDFTGFITSYQFNKQCRLTGMSLNGLLHRSVIPQTVTELTGDVETLARSALANVPWLTLGEITGFTNTVKYSTDNYLTADTYIQELLVKDGAGYNITADFENKNFIFTVLKASENPLVISEGNLNAYNPVETYINKDLAYGGWYKDSEEEWHYINPDGKTGIYKIDTVLSSETEAEALEELSELKSKSELTVETKTLKHGEDYKLGDIVRVQNDGMTVQKKITAFEMWADKGSGEQPILEEV